MKSPDVRVRKSKMMSRVDKEFLFFDDLSKVSQGEAAI